MTVYSGRPRLAAQLRTHRYPGRSSAPTGGPSQPASAAGTRAPAGCVASVVAVMPVEARVGQLLMIGTPVGNPVFFPRTAQWVQGMDESMRWTDHPLLYERFRV